jgi:hypothetical protein
MVSTVRSGERAASPAGVPQLLDGLWVTPSLAFGYILSDKADIG